MSIYYTYVSYETDKSLFEALSYVGYRKLKDAPTPEEEDYFGSPSSIKNLAFKNNPNKAKVILGKFDNKEDAVAHEIYLHKLWDVANNPRFANASEQTGEKFSYSASGLDHPRADTIKRDWFNVKKNIVKIAVTNYELYKEFNNSSSGFPSVISGEIVHYAGWMLLGYENLSLEERIAEAKTRYEDYEKKKKDSRRNDKTKRDWCNYKSGATILNATIYDVIEREGLPSGSLISVVNAERFHYKGWCLLQYKNLPLEERITATQRLYIEYKKKSYEKRKRPIFKRKKYTWENTLNGKHIECTVRELHTLYPELLPGSLNKLTNGSYFSDTYKKWRVLNCIL